MQGRLVIGLILLVRSFIVPGEPLGQFALKAGVPIILSTVLFGLNQSQHCRPFETGTSRSQRH